MVLFILSFTFVDSRREDKRLNRMVASIPQIKSALNLFVHAIFIYYYCSQIFGLCHIFKGPIFYHFAMLLSYLLIA
jgi:hypothetical protein